MKTRLPSPAHPRAFTLLEVVIVLAITALVLGAVYSLAQGALTLADDVSRAERRDARTQAFSGFCEHLLGELPATALVNLITTESGGQYLTRLELEHVRSPFDETPDCRVILFTEAEPGGALRLVLSCQPANPEVGGGSVVLFENLTQCEWSVLHPTTRQWVPFWSEVPPVGMPKPQPHPPLLKLTMREAAGDSHEPVFWIVPVEAGVTIRLNSASSGIQASQ